MPETGKSMEEQGHAQGISGWGLREEKLPDSFFNPEEIK